MVVIDHYYYPKDLLGSSLYSRPALIVGLQISRNDYMIITILPFKASELKKANWTVNTNGRLLFRGKKSKLKFQLLGYLNYQKSENPRELSLLYNSMTKYPISSNLNRSVKIILFDVVDPRIMQFYSLEPVDLGFMNNKVEHSNSAIYNKLEQHALPNRAQRHDDQFTQVLTYLNECFQYRDEFYRSSAGLRNLNLVKPWEMNFSVSRNLTNFKFQMFNTFYVISKSSGFFHDIILKQMFAKTTILSRILIDYAFKILNSEITNSKKVSEISLTAKQIDLRLQQICLIINLFIDIKKRNSFIDYIKLYNVIWLLLNDIIIGITLAQFIKDNIKPIENFLVEIVLKKYLFDKFHTLTIWLMNYPAGFKLNLNLTFFFGELFLWIIEFFFNKIILTKFFINSVLPFALMFSAIIGSIFGASLTLSIFYDFTNFITLHIYCFYFASSKILNWFLVILKSLFNLFHGKKNNVLKKRIDSADYNLDQLLLGTLLFTITLFILPTIIIFYSTFTLIRLSTLTVIVAIELLLSLLNHFPIFTILLRIKDQFRVPNGIFFRLVDFQDDDNSNDNGNIVYLEIKNVPITFNQILSPYFSMLENFKRYYLSVTTVKKILTGIPINVSRDEFYSLFYTMLPAEPIETGYVIKCFKEFSSVK